MNNKQLKEASEYLISNYDGLRDIIMVLGTKRPIGTIIMNVYRFRKIEEYGYSLEDVFLEVYVAILEMERENKQISNLTQTIQAEIVKYIRDDFVDLLVRKITNLPGSIETKLLDIQPRRIEYDFNNITDESSIDFVDDIINRHLVECLFRKSHLTDREKLLITKNILEDRHMSDLAREYDRHQTRLACIRNRGFAKMRYAFVYRLRGYDD